MFTLCTKVENIIVDMESFDEVFLKDSTFSNVIYELNTKYKLIFGKVRYIMSRRKIERKTFDIPNLMKLNDLKAIYTIVVTNSLESVSKAHDANLSTILIVESNNKNPIDYIEQKKYKTMPDIILSIEGVSDLLMKNNEYGLSNELSAQQNDGEGKIYFLGEESHQLSEKVKANLMYAGRYFPTEDSRSYIHSLSKILLKLKNTNSSAVNTLAKTLNMNIEKTRRIFSDINIITTVPAKPNKINHLDSLLKHEELAKFNNMIDTDLLFTTEDYKKQTKAGTYQKRAENVLDVFEAKKDILGHVLIIDDIFTSGSTTMECAKVLYERGAEKVTILPLAITQAQSNAPKMEKIKNTNDKTYELNFNNQNGNPFFIASGKYLDYDQIKERYLDFK